MKEVKEGLISENGELVYYENGVAVHAGAIQCGEEIYYISKGGKAVKGVHFVHESMTNGIIKSGMYEFDDECRLVRNLYIKRKKISKAKAKMNLKIILISVFVFFSAILMVFGFITDKQLFNNSENENKSSENETTSTSDASGNDIFISEIKSEVLLCSDEAKKLYDGDITIEEAIITGNPYRSFEFEYSIKNDKNWRMILSESEDMSSAREFTLLSSEKLLNIDNLKTDKKYYYEISCGETVLKGTFKTAPSYRFIYMDGVHNVRDIGGVKTESERTLKQGMIIRGSEIDGLVVNKYFLKSESIKDVSETLKIKYDFDLRDQSLFSGKYVSRLGNNVKHDFYNAPSYGYIFNETVKETMKTIFSSFADENKYPMYLHCTHGADRTGCVVFILQALLGVSEEDAVKEYRLTAYEYDTFVDNNGIEIVLAGLNSYEGDTLSEKAHNYLTQTIGVTEQEIESIKKILLE